MSCAPLCSTTMLSFASASARSQSPAALPTTLPQPIRGGFPIALLIMTPPLGSGLAGPPHSEQLAERPATRAQISSAKPLLIESPTMMRRRLPLARQRPMW